MRSKICLIRHGITTANIDNRFYGAADVPLSQKGIERLNHHRDSGLYPAEDGVDFYTTGMTRTEQTLTRIYGDKEHGIIEDLREMEFGDLEMMDFETLKANDEYWGWFTGNDIYAPAPGGESIVSFKERIARGYDTLKEYHAEKVAEEADLEGETMTVMICHGGTISAIMSFIEPDRHQNMFEWVPNPGHGYTLTLENGEVVDFVKF